MLGVPGIFDVYRAGRVTIVNAPGAGIADDKAIYTYIPEIIEFYTGRAADPEERADLQLPQARRAQVRARASAGAGGQGGARLGRLRHAGRPDGDEGGDRDVPHASSRPTRATTSPSRRWRCRPARRWSRRAWRRAISICGPSCCSATEVRLTPGGLTRVALREGSLVVNSSQGGGTKDTWVLQD